MINIGGIIGVLPLTGIPLPFVSHGGTALFINLVEVGIIMNISRNSRK
jgi:cell division protein FtsW